MQFLLHLLCYDLSILVARVSGDLCTLSLVFIILNNIYNYYRVLNVIDLFL